MNITIETLYLTHTLPHMSTFCDHQNIFINKDLLKNMQSIWKMD